MAVGKALGFFFFFLLPMHEQEEDEIGCARAPVEPCGKIWRENKTFGCIMNSNQATANAINFMVIAGVEGTLREHAL